LHDHVEIVAAAAGVFTDESFLVGLVNGTLELDLLVPELTSDVDVGGFGAHAETDDKCTFDELVWVVSKNLTILARAWLGLICVDNQVGWSMTEGKS